MESSFFSKRDEIANAITHGIGALLATAALVLLTVFSAMKGSAWHVSSFVIFGSTMVVLYVMSTIYHSLSHSKAKRLFRKFDHMSIFLLIAGTYTPFCLTALNGWLGWTLFGIVWFCAFAGIAIKAFYEVKAELLSTALYIVMGWMVVFFIKPVYDYMTFQGFLFLLVGGVFYTLGTFFFVKDKIPFNHSIWHLFVLGGSISHFFAVLTLL